MAQRSNQDVAQLKKMRDQTNRIASANDEAVLKLSGAGLAVSFAIMRFLGRLPHRRTPTGGVVAALTPYRRWGLDPSGAATITPEDGDRSHFVGWIEGRR